MSAVRLTLERAERVAYVVEAQRRSRRALESLRAVCAAQRRAVEVVVAELTGEHELVVAGDTRRGRSAAARAWATSCASRNGTHAACRSSAR
jgi:16S rRNA C1402 (ribose-2'-O) methylase RsmI